MSLMPAASPFQTLRRVLHNVDEPTARRLRRAFGLACLLAPVEVLALALVVPLLALFTGENGQMSGVTEDFADFIGTEDPQTLALVLGVAVIVLFIARAAATLALRRWTLGVLAAAERDVTVRLLDGYLREPYQRHLKRNSSEVLRTLFTSVERTFGGYMSSVMSFTAELLVGASIFLLLLVLEPVATALITVYFAVVGPVYLRLVQRRAYGLGSQLQDASTDAYRTAGEALDGIKEILVLQRQATFVQAFKEVRATHASASVGVNFLREAPRYFIEIVFLLGVALLIAVLGLTGSGDDALLALGIFVAAGFRLMPPLGRMIAAQSTMRTSIAGVEITVVELERFDSLTMDRAPSVVSPVGFELSLEFRDACFRYDGADRDSLSELNFVIGPGEAVAVVGRSGAGKTTLVDLMLGLLSPSAGEVLVDGQPLASQVANWRKLVGYVPQDVFLIDGTLRANIAFGVAPGDVDEDALSEALEGAHLDHFVSSLASGLETAVGERGVRLSGGQRQRIGIARALYQQPRFLVLDEATSSLDGETEALIAETVRSLRGRMTVVAIAHRLTTLRDFERVLFIEGGRLAGDGTFDDLARSRASFASMLEQAHFRRPRDGEADLRPRADGDGR
jgi:ATP-binding cassette, subfamily B, bacterial PglK